MTFGGAAPAGRLPRRESALGASEGGPMPSPFRVALVSCAVAIAQPPQAGRHSPQRCFRERAVPRAAARAPRVHGDSPPRRAHRAHEAAGEHDPRRRARSGRVKRRRRARIAAQLAAQPSAPRIQRLGDRPRRARGVHHRREGLLRGVLPRARCARSARSSSSAGTSTARRACTSTRFRRTDRRRCSATSSTT